MERKIEKQLMEWHQSAVRVPLILTGARQVGKTYTLLTFGKKYFQHVAYFNFESNSSLQQIFERDLSPQRIIRELSAISGERITEKDTLIIFDEIQACEKALTSLKYFNEQAPGYAIAAAGSLLGIAINRKNFSFPVGKVQRFNLYPLDFEEFLWAMGQKTGSELIREAYNDNTSFSLHGNYLEWYNIYLLLGGMPQVVKEYSEHKDFNFVLALQKNIRDAYLADMAKYASPGETVKIMGAYNSIGSQLAKENHKFQYKLIRKGGRANEYEGPIDWLKASGIICKCIKVSHGKFPLSLYANPDSFKIYLSDCGLLCSGYGISSHLMRSAFTGFENVKGALAENFVINTLTANNYTPYYWESQGKAEVDFIIQNPEGEIIPIEVKSSENIRSKSLNQYISIYKPSYSIRISTKNFGFENNIKSLPLYAAFCI